MTTLLEYQNTALKTAQPEAFSLDYLVPGIVGEVGELFGHKAKAHWHGKGQQELNVELVAEYGDIAWMTAILLNRYDLHVETAPVRHTTILHAYTNNPWQLLLSKAYSLHMFYADTESHAFISTAALTLWKELRANCEAITGSPFDHVLAYNVDKLAARAARGVLRGSGDHR